MTAFLVIALLMVACVLAIIFPALMNKRPLNHGHTNLENIRIARDRLAELNTGTSRRTEDIELAERELEISLLDDLEHPEPSSAWVTLSPKWGVAILILIPLVGIGLYGSLGNLHLIDPVPSSSMTRSTESPTLAQLLEQLEAKISADPLDADGWWVAANAYMMTGDFHKAENAYSTLHELLGGLPDVLAGWADATIMVNNNVYVPEARQRVEHALALDANHIDALWIAGLGAQSLGEHDRALGYFHRLLPLLEQDEVSRNQVIEFIATSSDSTQDQEKAVQPPRSIEVTVSLSPELVDVVKDSDTVFISAKAVNGPPMPLAVSRHTADELPIVIQLDDSKAMLPEMKISDFPKVIVSAKISKSGNAITQSGDLVSEEVIIESTGLARINLLISKEANSF